MNHIYADLCVSIQTITSSPGFIGEKLGYLHTTDSTWKLINKIELTQLMTAKDMINGWLIETKKICPERCVLHLDLIHEETKLIQIDIELEKTLTQLGKRRIAKRSSAPLSFVGNIARALFGVLTEKDKKILENMNQYTYNHSLSIAELMKNFTQIVHNQVSNISRYADVMDRELKEVHRDLDEIRRDVNLQVMMNQIREAIFEFQTDVNVLTHAVALGYLGVLYPTFFDNSQWKNAINTIRLTKLNARFPLDEDNDSLNNIAKISDIKIY